MLQKIVNGIAIASGVVSLTVVGAVRVVYLNKDAIIENVKGKIMEAVMPDGLDGIVGGGLPDLGGKSDSAIPPVGEGFGIPSF